MIAKLSTVLKERHKSLSDTLFIDLSNGKVQCQVMHMFVIVKVLSLKSERKIVVKKVLYKNLLHIRHHTLIQFDLVDRRCFVAQRIQYQKMHLHLRIQCKRTPELSSVHIR